MQVPHCTGSSLFHFSAAEELCHRSQLAQPVSKVVSPQPCTLPGGAKRATVPLHHHTCVCCWRGRREKEEGVGGWWPLPCAQPWADTAQAVREQPRRLLPTTVYQHQLCFITGLPLRKSLPMSDNCFRQLIVLGAEEIFWQVFSRS